MTMKAVWMFTGNQCHKYYSDGKVPIMVPEGTYCYDPSEKQKTYWAIFRVDGPTSWWEDVPSEQVPPELRARMLLLSP